MYDVFEKAIREAKARASDLRLRTSDLRDERCRHMRLRD
jgi:hypothetical protein